MAARRITIHQHISLLLYKYFADWRLNSDIADVQCFLVNAPFFNSMR